MTKKKKTQGSQAVKAPIPAPATKPVKVSSEDLQHKPLNDKQQRLAVLIIENRPDTTWEEIAEMAKYSVRQVQEIRKRDDFNAYINELLDSAGIKTTVRVDARGARNYLVKRRKFWPAIKDALDRTEGVAGGSSEDSERGKSSGPLHVQVNIICKTDPKTIDIKGDFS